MSINVYKCDVHPWPRNKTRDLINGINEKHFFTNVKSVKFKYFSGSAIGNMYFKLISWLK